MSDTKYRVTKVGKKEPNGDWTWETKVDAVQKFLSLGNVRATCDVTRVPYETLRVWRQEPWWATIVSDIQTSKRAALNNRLGGVVDKSLELVEDRLENGDFVLNNKTGQIMRKPAALKDVARIATDVIGRQIAMEELASRDTSDDSKTIQETLKELAAEFAKFNKQRIKNATDIPFVEIVE